MARGGTCRSCWGCKLWATTVEWVWMGRRRPALRPNTRWSARVFTIRSTRRLLDRLRISPVKPREPPRPKLSECLGYVGTCPVGWPAGNLNSGE
jgi:hypothetical protein